MLLLHFCHFIQTKNKETKLSYEKILIQQDGLAMGAPSSGLIAEFFLQNREDTHLTQLSINTTSLHIFDMWMTC